MPPRRAGRKPSGLVEWWARYRGVADDAEHGPKAAELVTYLAADIVPAELDSEEDDEDLDDADVFVEVKTARFLAVLDLPPISELPTPGSPPE